MSNRKSDSARAARKPRTVSRASFYITWPEACETAGGSEKLENLLKAQGKDEKTIYAYKKKPDPAAPEKKKVGVPIQEIGDALLQWWRGAFKERIDSLMAEERDRMEAWRSVIREAIEAEPDIEAWRKKR